MDEPTLTNPTQTTPPVADSPPANPYTVPNYSAGFQPPPAPTATVFSPPAKKSSSGKNIVIIGILILLLVGLILGFGKARSFLSKATGGGSCLPEGIKEANVTATSAEIVFQTDKACLTEIAYGISQDGMLLQVPEAMASLNHHIRLAPLLPSTTYFYQVVVDGKKVGSVRSFLTGVTQTPTLTPTSTSAPATVTYTVQDFETHLGTANPTFDIDKNGIVNLRDWLLYQKTKVQ